MILSQVKGALLRFYSSIRCASPSVFVQPPHTASHSAWARRYVTARFHRLIADLPLFPQGPTLKL